MAKDKFTFGEIFNTSLEEYKRNFKSIFKFVLLFMGIPYLVISILQFILISSDTRLFNMLSNVSMLEINQEMIKFPFYYQLISALFGIISVFLMVFLSVGLINASLKKSKFSFRELIGFGNLRYWKVILFGIVTGIFIILLFLALIIPGIIFLIYWTFALYIFLDKKTKIRDSLKQSRMMIKNRWWKTLGYSLLIGLIMMGIGIVLSIIQLPTIIITMIHLANNTPLSLTLIGISSLLEVITSFLTTLFATPLAIFFFKNYYLEIKKVYKEKEAPKARNKKRRK